MPQRKVQTDGVPKGSSSPEISVGCPASGVCEAWDNTTAVLRSLAEGTSTREAVVEGRAIHPLVAMLSCGGPECQADAVEALRHLALSGSARVPGTQYQGICYR